MAERKLPYGAFNFLVDLGARVNTELGLGLDEATLRQIACVVMAASDKGDPVATARHMYDLLIAAVGLN